MDDAQLSKLSLLELQELQVQLHTAIRAKIGAQQADMAARAGRPSVAPQKSEVAATSARDLAQERDAWLARRRAGPVA